MKPTLLRECSCDPIGGEHVPEMAVVKGCKIGGLVSRNGRRYTPEVFAKAVALYENRASYVDHPAPASETPRSFISKFGVFHNVQARPDGLYGDYHYNPTHLYAETFRGWLKTDPTAIGFSHNAYCKTKPDPANPQGELVVEICEVVSVDLVADPATTKGLFESYLPREPMEPELETPGESGGLDAAVAALVAAIMGDKGLSPEEKKKKIMIALKLDEGGGGEPEPEPEPIEEEEEGDMDDESATEEAAKLDSKAVKYLLARLDAVRINEAKATRREEAKRICKDAGVLTTEALVEYLADQRDEAAMKRLLEAVIKPLNTRNPISLPPHPTSKSLSVDDMVKALEGRS